MLYRNLYLKRKSRQNVKYCFSLKTEYQNLAILVCLAIHSSNTFLTDKKKEKKTLVNIINKYSTQIEDDAFSIIAYENRLCHCVDVVT